MKSILEQAERFKARGKRGLESLLGMRVMLRNPMRPYGSNEWTFVAVLSGIRERTEAAGDVGAGWTQEGDARAIWDMDAPNAPEVVEPGWLMLVDLPTGGKAHLRVREVTRDWRNRQVAVQLERY